MGDIDLGQVFTSKSVAEHMVSLFSLSKDAKILDPCFGTGAFIKSIIANGYHSIDGYEIDNELYCNVKKQFPSLTLLNKDFLTTNTSVKYDGIIMNPPYIRQEKIDDLKQFGITKKVLRGIKLYNILPRTANLYMYFIVKAIDMLKISGELIVIFPSSWIKAQNGKSFKEYILSKCSLSNQIHITGEVFEKNALVEVIILKLVKGKKSDQPVIEHKKVENGVLIKQPNPLNFTRLGFETQFNRLATVRRGLTTGYNAMFINPNLYNNETKAFLHPILSSPKNINGYGTIDARTDKVLLVNKDQEVPEEISLYMKKCKQLILDNKSPKTFYNKINNGDDWFILKKFNCEGILFSYFVRNDMKFVYNDANYLVRDNFYIIYPKIDKYLLFSLLNNYYTYYQLEILGKKYGAGLLKLQRYDIEDLCFPNIDLFPESEINKLKFLAKKLISDGDVNIVEEITQIIACYSTLEYSSIVKIYKNEKSHRLE